MDLANPGSEHHYLLIADCRAAVVKFVETQRDDNDLNEALLIEDGLRLSPCSGGQMKRISFLLTAVLLSTQALAGSSWVPAEGASCKAVCKKEGKSAVTFNNVAGYDTVEVCAAAANTKDAPLDKSPRPGFTMNDGAISCAVHPGFKLSQYLCLCVDSGSSAKPQESAKSDNK
jgi:hypothetical protein